MLFDMTAAGGAPMSPGSAIASNGRGTDTHNPLPPAENPTALGKARWRGLGLVINQETEISFGRDPRHHSNYCHRGWSFTALVK